MIDFGDEAETCERRITDVVPRIAPDTGPMGVDAGDERDEREQTS